MNTENHYQETDLGNISLNPRSEYNPEESYEYLDLVVFKGGSYVCLAENGITGISPESGKTTQYWQVITIPGDLTPEYVAMHDRVINLSEQVGADAEEVRASEQNVSGMEENITRMQEQTRQSAESAEQSKDSAAGYASSADASRRAAEESEQNINAQITGFDIHAAEKTEEAENDIEAARIAANKAIIAQQEQSVNEVSRVGIEAVSTARAAAQTATEKAQAADTSEKNAAASEAAAKLSEENATKMAEQVATDKEQIAHDRTAVENAKQEMAGSVAQIEQNTQGISELKSDLDDKLEKANGKVYIGDIVDNKWQQDNGNEYNINYGFYLSANVQPNTKYYATGTQVNNNFPLVVMFDENNNVIGKKGFGESIAEYNYEFVTPSNCVKASVNGIKIKAMSYSNYPSLYYIQNKDLDGNDLESQINSKQNELPEWGKATYQYEANKYVMIKTYKATVISNSTADGYKYAKLIYDKNKKYRFFGECKTDVIPILICCDENDNIIKIYGNKVGEVLKGEEYNDIPENTYCIYVNGYNLTARVEIKEQRNTTSFESKKIGVCFGDSITQGNNVYISSSITPINDYPSVVGKTLDCTVYNGGLGGSTYSSGRSIDFKNVCDCVVSGDFSTVINGISQYGLNASAVLQYNAISELDFNDVDFISIALGTNDWNFGASTEGIKNAMRYCISTLLTAYPHLKVYVFTPIYRFNLGGSGQDSDNYVNTSSGLKLHDVCDAIIETAKEFNIPCKDMYYGCNINHYNKELYMGDDTHPNANGYALMGEKIAKFINSN